MPAVVQISGGLGGGPKQSLLGVRTQQLSPGPSLTRAPIVNLPPGLEQGQTTVYNGPATTATRPSTKKTSGASSTTRTSSAASAAASGAASAANTYARTGANSSKSALQQAIDANNAQIGANQGKLDQLQKLVDSGLSSSRDSKLADIDKALSTLLSQMRLHHESQSKDLLQNQKDNESSEGDASFAALVNRGREKQDIIAQALSQGAGESDVLKSQLQALRNWSVNQGEINRSFYDTRTSINSAITDLNSGTQTNLVNAELDANAKKSGVFDDYYSALADAYTQMDTLATNNYLLGLENQSKSDEIGVQDQLLKWLDSGKSAESWVEPVQAARMASPQTFTGYADKAASAAADSWVAPEVSDASKNFAGTAQSTTELTSTRLSNAQTNTSNTGTNRNKRPEGATLRRW